jgi:hypothetical protein
MGRLCHLAARKEGQRDECRNRYTWTRAAAECSVTLEVARVAPPTISTMIEWVWTEETDRREPLYVAAEHQMLESWLEFHRATLLTKCEGLNEDQLKTRSAPPSSISLLGLIRHMSDVERYWFRCAMAGTHVRPAYSARYDEDGPFDDVGTADVAADLAHHIGELDLCRREAAEHPDLDAVRAANRGGGRIDVSVRWIYLHMIEEYARHNGHADLLRERIDGVTGV